jgi:hydroxymethylpyrimidine pyrophosphatase-like HAD family hydrolase
MASLQQWVYVLRYSVLASDYDGTLALDGRVAEPTLDAIRRFKEAKGRLVLVTGRDMADLRGVFPQLDVCDLIVAENGAVIYDPGSDKEVLLAPEPPPGFVHALRVRGVTPLLLGRVIVSTRQPHERDVEELIAQWHLPMHVIFNKGAVMVLPFGVNKGAGLAAALDRLSASPETVVAVGDAENDHSLLAGVGLGAAVSNALPSLRDEADVILSKPATEGVEQLIGMMLSGDPRLVSRMPSIGRPVSELTAAAEETSPASQ